jgi:uncharacterized membrane protein
VVRVVSTTTEQPVDGRGGLERSAPAALRRASTALVATVWVSMTLFGVYILAFYAGAVVQRDLPSWNAVLPRLYERSTPAATLAIGLHFAAGGLILVLGCVQLVRQVRERHPALHRSLGRVYVVASLLAGVGGLAFILAKGTVGGPVMDVGFGLYGVLMAVAAVQTYRWARARLLARHQAWALRLFALALGSWLYRMDYGFWLLLTGGVGHTSDFRGWFDVVMAFAFYLPNLLVVEAYLRGRRPLASPGARWLAVAVLLAATVFLVLGTFFFTVEVWAPAVVGRFTGGS